MDINKVLLWFCLCLTASFTFSNALARFQHTKPATVIQPDGRIRGVQNREESDILLGGLFPIHIDSAGGSACGKIRRERGLERMEAMLYALDLVNNDSTLLPGLKVGFDIRDTCNSENIGLDESIDLVVAAGDLVELESCATNNASATLPSTTAVIGAASSGVSVPVATLLRLFKIPQVSYASSSARLNNRDRYSYFFRTISADNLQAEAMIDLCIKYEWTYVSTIYANNFYGEPGIDEFRALARIADICIDVDEGINDDFEDDDYQRLALKLINSTADVVVLFASQDAAGKLFEQLNATNARLGTSKRFLWIASDAWARSVNVVSKFKDSLVGLFGVAPSTEFHAGFDEYFSQLTPNTNKRNPWFNEFYNAIFMCGNSSSDCENPNRNITEHTNYKQGNFIPLVIDAVYSVVHAISNSLKKNCDQPFQWYHNNHTCKGSRDALSGQKILEELKNVSFVSPTGKKVSFDSNGNVEGLYEILNYQLSNSKADFVSVGLWNGTEAKGRRLKIYPDMVEKLQFGLRENGSIIRGRQSQCQVCLPGQRRRSVVGACCDVCDDCLGQEFSNSTTATECTPCTDNTWGNNPLNGSTSCVPVSEEYLEYSSPWSIILLLLAVIGLLSVVFVSIVMLKYWNTPIIKSSGREQMIMLLIGITLCFLWTFLFVSKPSIGICFFQRLGLWLCFSLILGALLIKLIRIARIFLRPAASSRPKFTAPHYQIVFTLIVVAVQMLLLLISLIVIHPNPSTNLKLDSDNNLDFPVLVITCSAPHAALLVIQIVYDTALVIACNALAILTIRFPDNFNESRYVSFSTFALGLIWITFVPSYVTTAESIQTAVVSFALNLSAFAILGCLFGPRIFIILVFPERNSHEFNKTSTNMPSLTTKSIKLASIDVSGNTSIQTQVTAHTATGNILKLYILSTL